MNADTATPGELAQWLIDESGDADMVTFADSVLAQMRQRGATAKQVAALRGMVKAEQTYRNGYDPLNEWDGLVDDNHDTAWGDGHPLDFGDK